LSQPYIVFSNQNAGRASVRHLRKRGDNVTRCATWALWTVLLVLASPGFCAADEGGSGETTGGAGTHASVNASERIRQTDSWFDLHALDLNVYGLSYHPDRETARRMRVDNEINPGLGLHYELTESSRGVSFAEAGAYYDSGRNWAKFAGLGYQFKLGEKLKIGGAIAAMHSKTYNGGVGFVAMIPLITYDLGRIKLNAVYLPKFGDHNKVAAWGFYFSIPLGQWVR
jgi:hypothetical protein